MKNIADILKELFSESERDNLFLVGGGVRDRLQGKKGNDIDLVAALPANVIESRGFYLVKARNGAEVWFKYVKGTGKIEITQLADTGGLTAQLAKRDFTINAMAMTLAGEIIDPLNGRRDLEQRLLRACSPSAFPSDPLRIFRAFRFEADGWRMTAGTEALIREQSWGQKLATIPVERFSREMIKALELPAPARFFHQMLNFQVGDGYLPEIFRMPFIPAGPPVYHPEGDLFTHSIQVLQRVALQSNNPLSRFCAMFHDIGKLSTSPDNYPRHHGHDEAGFEPARMFCNRLCLPAAYRTALAWISKLHGKANLWPELRESTKLRIAGQAIKAGITDILPLVSIADKPGGIDLSSWDYMVRIAQMTTSELGIDPVHLESMPLNKRSGYILNKRLEKLRGH